MTPTLYSITDRAFRADPDSGLGVF